MKKIITTILLLFCISFKTTAFAANMNIEPYFDSALSKLKIENYTKSAQLNSEEYLKKAYKKYQFKDYRGSIADCTSSISLKTDNFYAYALRSLDEYQIRRYEAARDDCTKAIEINSSEFFVYCLRAINEYKLKDYLAGMKDCSKAIELSPQQDFIYCLRALNEFKLKDYKDSLEDCKIAININPDCYLAYLIRGLNKAEIEDYRGSMKDYAKAIKLHKESFNPPKNINKTTTNPHTYSANPILTTRTAPSPTLSTSKPAETDFIPYLKELERKIKHNWVPPHKMKSRRVVVSFKIAKSGELLESKVLHSSGDKEADVSALKAVETSKPFAPLPTSFKNESVDVQFTFDYNVFLGQQP